MRWILITGLPATGKSTLARQLAERYRLPLLAKDDFKERLLENRGALDAAGSRELSNRSFNMLFAQLEVRARGGADALLEGNFRAGEHEALLRAWPAARITQVLCRSDEASRLIRIAARAGDPARHPGHGDARAARDARNDEFLDLPGQRHLFRTGGTSADAAMLLEALDRWWRQNAAPDSRGTDAPT